MILEYLRYSIDASRQDSFVDAYRQAAPKLLDSPYALDFEMARCVDDPSQFIIRISWTSAEDHMTKFRGSDAFRAFFSHVRPYVGDILEMRHYEKL